MEDIIEYTIEEETAMTAYRLKVDTDRKPELTDSKFGGVPYWDPEDPEKEYPRDSGGRPLVLLAQLNMKDFAGSPLLPPEGILQFFIGNDDVYGLDFDAPDSQKAFRVVYHSNIREDVTTDEILAVGITLSAEDEEEETYFPFEGEYAVDIEKTISSMGPQDYRYEAYMRQAAEEMGISLPENASVYEILSEEQYNREAEKNAGHWVLGYPYFTQNDPREGWEEMAYYDTLLFQMDSDFGNDQGYEILWGDCGVAGFFVNREDLKRRDFSKVLYNWDCC